MSDSLDLAKWQQPAYPRGIRIIQFENEVVFEPTPTGWQIHNRTANSKRNAVGFTAIWLCVVVAVGWLLPALVSSVPRETLWMWTAIVGGWTWFCAVGGLWVQWRLSRRRPALLAVKLSDNNIVESTNSAIVGGRLISVVLRRGRKTDPENRSGLKIVQVAAVFDRDGKRLAEPLWTFDRSFLVPESRSIERRFQAAAAVHRFEVLLIDGDPPLVPYQSV
ncbi:MAG TPA: hypothetical protein VHC70_02390 [Phycisphaerales bacterium]|nr:hypothetical protein [Phycisphaerales bacterium]